MIVVEHLRSGIEFLPALARFTIGMVLIVAIPKLARRVRLPEAVGLLRSRLGRVRAMCRERANGGFRDFQRPLWRTLTVNGGRTATLDDETARVQP